MCYCLRCWIIIAIAFVFAIASAIASAIAFVITFAFALFLLLPCIAFAIAFVFAIASAIGSAIAFKLCPLPIAFAITFCSCRQPVVLHFALPQVTLQFLTILLCIAF